MPANRDVTSLLLAWRGGDESALETLLPLVYDQLKQIAARFLRRESRRHPLQTTALVHEAYLRLVDLDRVNWQDRTHFFAVTAQLMRRILIDLARHHSRMKRGAGIMLLPLDEIHEIPIGRAQDLLALDQALRDLAAVQPEMARIVELRYFGGLNREEIAQVLSISSATVTRRWRAARAWLLRHLSHDREGRTHVDT